MDPSYVAVATAAMLRLAPSHVDRNEPLEARQVRTERVARAAVAAARNRLELALLLAYGARESHYASLVVEGHCDRMPAGERCDRGSARGPWSIHPWCRAAYAFPAGSDESLAREALCALGQARSGMVRCRAHAATPLHGAFAALAAAPCSWSGADRRVRLTYRMDALLATIEASPGR